MVGTLERSVRSEPSEYDPEQSGGLRQLILLLIPLEAVFGLVSTAAYLVFHQALWAAVSGWLSLYLALTLVALRRINRGAIRPAVVLLCVGLIPSSSVLLFFSPWLLPAMVQIPLLLVAIALPFTSEGTLKRMMLGCLGWTMILGLIAGFAGRPHGGIEIFRNVFLVSSSVTASGVVLLLLWQFKSRLSRLLTGARESDARTRLIVESTLDAVVTMDSDGVITGWNQPAQSMFGWTAEEAVGRTVAATIVRPEQRDAHLRGLRRYLETGYGPVLERRVEMSALHRSGRTFPVELAISASGTNSGMTFSAFIRDITERKEFEALRRTVSGAMAAGHEQERQRIAAEIAEDPIQKMAAVGMRLRALRSRLSDERQLEAMERLEESVVLGVSRLRHLMFELRPPSLDRGGIGTALREYLDEAAAEGGLRVGLADRLEEEPGEEARIAIYRIAQEALTNVVEHSRAANVAVVLESRDDGVLLRVHDDGIGFKVASELAQPSPGRLGLSAMQERAELLGGWMRVESQPNPVGTTVEVWVPR